jgi:hypothetical protein
VVNYLSIKNRSMGKCPSGMELKEDDNYCTCDPSCEECSFDINTSSSSCLKCKPFLSINKIKPVIFGPKCLEKCPPGFVSSIINSIQASCTN